jgi:hypothetical protein
MLAVVAPMASQRAGRPGPGGARPTGAAVRAIAERFARDHDRPPAVGPGDPLAARGREPAPEEAEGA